MAGRPPIILHVDMDAFYASVEQRDQPELRGRPVIVGGGSRRGVVAAASYEARRFGVHSAMPGFKARRLCPQGVFLAPRIGHYAAVSSELMGILDRYCPQVEPLSLDEAFLDMTGSERLFGTPAEMAAKIRQTIAEELRLTASVGAASNKFIAKIASDMNKPDGMTICPPGHEEAFLAPLPLERIWGVGKRSAEQLHALGLRTIGDIARYPRPSLESRFGKFGAHIWRLAHGEDDREVVSGRSRKSLGSERTLAVDLRGRAAVRHELLALADDVARGLRSKGWRAWGVRLKLKYADFRQVTRDMHLTEPVSDADSLMYALDALLDRAQTGLPIRLVGCAAYDLVADETPMQQGLFVAEKRVRREELDGALDAVRERFGAGTIRRGSHVRRDQGQSSDG